MQLVLASSSPRRRELLALLGLSFEVCPSEFHEQPEVGLSPVEQVRRFAREKARSVALVRPRALVLGCDTVIDLDGQLLGKPVDLVDARAMLARLADRSHHVHTAVALCDRTRHIESVEVATTEVQMKADLDHAYERYVASEESFGKAGAYAIQGLGGDLVERIIGDYTTVVGLPLKLVTQLLRSVDYPLSVNVEALYRRKPYANWNRFAV
ncbi:MAG: septum formation protein Maf [Nitrospira sp. LK70]|nr:septum formation protein Maf [Nitrospira sp. LK70]